MCWALLAFMISFNLFLPELNSFLTDMGGEPYKGLIFFMFSISALISRPFSGKLSDTIGRKKVMYIGVVFGIIAILSYPVFEVIAVFFTLRFIHGISAGFLPTGATALITDVIPTNGRGVAMGIWGTFISVGFGFGNFFATYLEQSLGMTGLFIVAAGFCLLAGFLIMFVRETLPDPQPFQFSHLKVKWNDVIEPSVRPAAFIMFCSATSTGVMFVTTPDISEFLGIENKGWFFLFYMIATIVVRLFASSLSDHIGRRKVLIIGLSFMAISMLTIGFSKEWIQFTIGATLFGVATGISSPTVFAWLADLSPTNRRGVASGTVFMALEFAIMFGALITLSLYDSTILRIPICYTVAASFSLVGVLYLIWHLKRRESVT